MGDEHRDDDVVVDGYDISPGIHYERITVAGPEIVGVRPDPGGLRAQIGAGGARKG